MLPSQFVSVLSEGPLCGIWLRKRSQLNGLCSQSPQLFTPEISLLFNDSPVFLVPQKLPYFLVLFSLAAGSLQYGIMRRDQATHLAFGKTPHVALGVVLHVLRFISGVHVYYALALFWSVPTCVMLMAGYSMIEYQGNNRCCKLVPGCFPYGKAPTKRFLMLH